MPIPTSRTNENGQIEIIDEKCTGCALCVEICKDFSLEIIDGKAAVSKTPFFGCFGCGQCMAICPHDAIKITGRAISPDDLFDLPEKKEAATYSQLLSLMQRRRAIRDFKDQAVEKDLIDKVIEAAKTAPMGLPPSDVNVLVFENKEQVRAFAKDFCDYIESLKWLVSKWFTTLMRPFWGKEADKMFRGFLRPLIYGYTDAMAAGKNFVTYDAPAGLYFYGSPYSDPADPIVAATYAMLAAESLGLATCMIGGVHPFIQSGGKAKKFRQQHQIKFKSKEGVIVLMGFPKYKFKKGIKRSFANLDRLN